ncbi:MAG: hypothetical protein LUD00_01170 [Prevotellaceae bacterium]|nr:hypothetical protein [Prevotellaceae bacterium]
MRIPSCIALRAPVLALSHIYISHAAAQSDRMLHTQEILTEKSRKFIERLQNDSDTTRKGKKSLLIRFDSLLSKMYETKTDTHYVVRPSTQWTLKIRTDFKATTLTVEKTNLFGKHYTYEMSSEEKKDDRHQHKL